MSSLADWKGGRSTDDGGGRWQVVGRLIIMGRLFMFQALEK